MEITTPITRVRAAKTSGEARKAIADASFNLGVASKVAEKFAEAKTNLEAAGMEAADISSLLGDASTRITDAKTEANRSLDSVINAFVKALDGIKDEKETEKKLDSVRGLFEILGSFIPQTEAK